MSLGLTLVAWGSVAAVVAGVCAYLITLDEMQRHQGNRAARGEARRRAAAAAGFFLVEPVLVAVVLSRVVSPG